MLKNRTFQIKMIQDEPPKYYDISRPKNPEETSEAKAVEVVQMVTGCVVVGYTVCKSVDFFFRMAEHVIVNR